MLVLSIMELKARAQSYASPSVELALLQQREDQIDRHLESIDRNIEAEQQRINELQSDQSQIRGIGIGIGALIGLFQLIQVILQLRSKRS